MGDEHARAAQTAALAGLLDEVAHHDLRYLEVGDNAILEGADGHHAARGAAQHALGVLTHGLHFVALHGNNGRFPQHNTLVFDVDQGIGGAEVYPYIIGKHPGEFFEKVFHGERLMMMVRAGGAGIEASLFTG